jgi:plastocyanin
MPSVPLPGVILRRSAAGLHVPLLLLMLAACGGAPPSEGPTGASGSGATYTITAKDFRFSPSTLTVKAGVPLSVVLDNQDGSVPHGILVTPPGPGEGPWFEGEVVYGVNLKTYSIPALGPGIYLFSCPLHGDEVVVVTSTE